MTGKGGETVRLFENWKNGDQVSFRIPLNIRTERRYNNSVSLIRGPVYLSLRIKKEYKSVKLNYDNFGYKGSVDWEIDPKSPWNYGLLYNGTKISGGIDLVENQVSRLPFADKGDKVWSSDSGKYYDWEKEPPFVLNISGMKIPEWTLKNNSADIPPLSPVKPEGTPEKIQLVPYGCAKLRITEFPVISVARDTP